MRYMMFIKHAQDYGNVQAPASLYEEMGRFIEETTRSGNFVGGAGLQPTSAGTRVKLKGGKITVLDGPFTESKEWIVGFDILECADLDEAIAIAAKHPQANGGKLELRPFWTDDE